MDMNGTPEQPRERKAGDDRRREIADAALQVIARHGVGGFTAVAIGHEVGLSDGALFRHFPTKEAIVLAAIDRVGELLFEGFPPEHPDPLRRLGEFYLRRMRVVRARPEIVRLFASEELSHAAAEDGARRLAEFRRRSSGFVRSCLQEAARRELLAPHVGVDEATLVVMGTLLAVAHARPSPGDSTELPERLWRQLETFLRGPPARLKSADPRPPREHGRPPRTKNKR